MALFKDVKKPVIRQAAGRNADISPLRPKFVEKASPCQERCPTGVDVRAWLTTIAQAEAYGRTPDSAFELAWRIIGERNPFPATLGRICPHPCEQGCHRAQIDGAVAVNALERAIGDLALARAFAVPRDEPTSRPLRVAVVGAGPAGLSCAYHLARRGHQVTVFEARDEAGGRLRDGIRSNRIGASVVDAEIERIAALGVEIRCGTTVAPNLGSLERDHDVVFVATGRAGSMGISGSEDGRTDRARVFAGGDLLHPGLVAAAIASGRRAADAIETAIEGRSMPDRTPAVAVPVERLKLDYYERAPRGAWTATVAPEHGGAVDGGAVLAEARRCLSCGACMDCERCWMFCTNNCFEKLPKGEHYRVKLEACNGCRKCADACPCGYLEMV